jgi:Icc-related predicted phosphoesterase
MLLLCGDLTTHGEPEQGAVLADACAELDIPVFAVLGNHDWHANRSEELIEVLRGGGIRVFDRDWLVCEASGLEVGLVGVKGFVGGFPGSHLPDFGEPLLREVYAETTRDVEALDQGLREIAACPTRIVMLHYAPCAPISEHEPDLVLHGHAHAGTFEGSIGDVPVYNVSVPVIGRDFWLFELDVPARTRAPIH